MTQFARVNGDFQAVAVFDDGTGNAYTNDGGNTNAYTANVAIQPQGPGLDFFTFSGANLQANAGSPLTAVIATIEQLATVHLYQVDANSGANSNIASIAVAIYPKQAWNDTSLNNAFANTIVTTTSGSYTLGTLTIADNASFSTVDTND
jgi:hypothetical protein